MKNIILIFIGIIFIIGCTKEGGNIYIEGRVYNPVTGEGYANVEVMLVKSQASLPGGFTGVKTVNTDAEGYYQLKHTGVVSYWAQVNVDTYKYYKLGWTNNNYGGAGQHKISIEKGKNMYADYEMVPKSKLRFEITNVNCQGPSDNFKLFFWGTEVGYQNDYIGAVSMEGNGCYESDDNSFADVPMGDRYYKIEITKNGQINSYFDTITLQENEEYVYVIDY